MYTTKQGGRVSSLAQTGFAAFGKGVQLISGCPYAEIPNNIPDLPRQAVYMPPHDDK